MRRGTGANPDALGPLCCALQRAAASLASSRTSLEGLQRVTAPQQKKPGFRSLAALCESLNFTTEANEMPQRNFWKGQMCVIERSLWQLCERQSWRKGSQGRGQII